MKVNILGTEYKVKFDYQDKDNDGEAFFYKKKIRIRPLKNMCSESATKKEKKERQKEVFRHELFHCLFHESGNDAYAYDEKLVDLLAVLSPKIFEMFQELDIL